MSRSRKRHIHFHWCGGDSNKSARSCANRKLRRKVTVKLHAAMRGDDMDSALPVLREASNVYDFPSDGLGKVYWHTPDWLGDKTYKYRMK